ncbi:hypothetical protein JHK85_043871 [Glycine max]|nr:hypothetical protein JHK86_043236 [Glycine max]KAG4957491.1 hypothetical protein JHK85_043871 [Glycine max]
MGLDYSMANFNASKTPTTNPLPSSSFESQLFIPPSIEPDEVDDSTIFPGSNIVVRPYAGNSRIKDVQFVKSSARTRDCPKDDLPKFVVLGAPKSASPPSSIPSCT